MSKRYLEIYSGRRDRQQYPSPANFIIPFGISPEVKDPILNGAIYYQWEYNAGFFNPVVYGSIISAANTGTVTLNAPYDIFPLSTVIDAYKGLSIYIIPPPGQGNSDIKTILTYNPSTYTVTVKDGFLIDATGSEYRIYYNEMVISGTVSATQIPYQDFFGNQILNRVKAYINYYLMDESLSSGTSIIAEKIYNYDYNIRTAYLGGTTLGTEVFQKFSLRKSLPEEKWTLDTPTYNNTDPSYGPIGPVITLPEGSSTINNYYVGKYVYFASNGPTSYTESPNFKPIYGAFRIKEYKANVRELFVDHDLNNNLLPNYIINQGTILEVDSNFLQLSNLTPQTPNISSYYYSSFITNTRNNETAIIYYIGYVGGKYGINAAFFGSWEIGDPYTITSNNVINIVSLQGDNAANLDYIGTMVSVNQAVCYDIELIELILPNTPLLNGTIISTYPFVYVHLKNVSSPNGVSPSTIYSNNPPSTDALFVVLITDITQPTTSKFVRLKCSTTVRVKFKPNDSLQFSVTLPDGNYVTPAQPDYFSPYASNPDLQIHATFGIKPV